MSDDCKRYREALERLDRGCMVYYAHDMQTIIKEALYPKPQMETVEVKRWLNLHTRSVQASVPLTLNDDWVELSGTFQREIKPKAKHREEIIVRCGDYQEPNSREYRSFTGLEKIYREWEE